MNRLTLLLAVACPALAGWAIWERMDNSRLADRVAALEKSSSGDSAASKAAPAAVPHPDAPKQKAAADSKADGKTVADASSTAAATEDGDNAMADGIIKMMKDPKMRDVMKAQARMGIDMMYRDLYDLLNLPEPKRSELEKLISEKTTAAMEIGFSALGSKKTPEELKAISDELKTKTAALDGQIKDLLGEEDFGQLKHYEDSTNERMHLQTLNSMLASKNIAMDEATETRLMDAMYEERKKLPFISSFTDQQNTDMTRFTPENLAQFGTQYEQLNQRVVTRAGGILSPEQLEVFQQSQDQMGAMTKMHLDMAAKMFGAQE